MANTPARLLSLLSLLQSPRAWPGSELAERLGVTARTIRRDVDRLRELGYPVEGTVGAAGGYRLVAGAAIPPLLLDEDEAVAIAVGLGTAAGHAVAGIEDASVRALAKLEQVLPARLRHRVASIGTATMPVAGAGPAVDPQVLTALAAAISNREKVRFRYPASDSEEMSRLVDPLRLVASGRRWYLLAYDGDRAGWRTFRVDRITAPMGVGVRAAPPELPAADAADYVAGRRWDWGTPVHDVSVTFHAPLVEVAGRLGDAPGEVRAVSERSCRLDSRRDDSLSWLAVRMIALGCEFDVHGPAELMTELHALSGRAARAAAGRGER